MSRIGVSYNALHNLFRVQWRADQISRMFTLGKITAGVSEPAMEYKYGSK